jgi:hypothetical protein
VQPRIPDDDRGIGIIEQTVEIGIGLPQRLLRLLAGGDVNDTAEQQRLVVQGEEAGGEETDQVLAVFLRKRNSS